MLSVNFTAAPVDKLLHYLPSSVAGTIGGLPVEVRGSVTEVRLRLNSPVSISREGGNYLLNPAGHLTREVSAGIRVTAQELNECVGMMCDSSYHTQAENIRRGFIALPNGFRAGVCGITGVGATGELSVNQITSINIRIPRFVRGAAYDLVRLYRERGEVVGTMIYSPPGGGKTTLLRDIVFALSRGEYGMMPMRVAVVDTRREIYMSQLDGGLVDVLCGYPKAEGIELATRTMNPEVIVCDELNADDRPDLIRQTASCGVPLIATTHAGEIGELYRRDSIKQLMDYGIFPIAVHIYRKNSQYQLTVENVV